MNGQLVTIQYPNTIELATQYVATAGLIPTSETAAIVCKGIDVNGPQGYEASANSQMTLYISYTKGAGETGVKLKFYDSYVGKPATFVAGSGSADWYQETIEADTLGVATIYPFEIDLTVTGQYAYNIPVSALRSFLVSVASYSAGTPGALTLTLGFRVN
jgi:hypothetical protein